MQTIEPLPRRSPERETPGVDGTFAKVAGPLALLITAGGALLLLPALGTAVLGVTNGAWYLSRSSALVAYFLLWASMICGVSITNKLARLWPGAPTAFELHRHTSLLGLGFAAVHVLSLLGDTYIGYTLAQLVVPFASTDYAPVWVGLGQIAFYLLIPVTISFYARKRLGTRGWRTIHGLSYGLFGLTLLHGLFSGTDSGTAGTIWLYWFTGSTLLALTGYRVLAVRSAAPRRAGVGASPPR